MIAVFTGPTIAANEAREILEARYLPPASQGDVYRAARKNPAAIAIIDGNFEGTPAIWHKEILWALSRGIPVYGSSSMGALRAAELDAYGMIGIGSVYEAFRDGSLEDDDEVAVVHGDAATGYRQLSDAMVDIRRRIRDALADGVIDECSADALVGQAKALFYKERTLAGALRICLESAVLSVETASRLRDWLATRRVCQKREDAVSLLKLLAETIPTKHSCAFHFEYSAMWNDFRLMYGDADTEFEGGSRDVVSLEDIVDELRLVPGAYREVFDAALLRLLSTRQFKQNGGQTVPIERLRDLANDFRTERNLLSESSVRAWSESNGLTFPDGLRAFVEELGRMATVREQNERNAWFYVANELRERGSFAELLSRARMKRRMLRDIEGAVSATGTIDTDAEITSWYYDTRLQRPELADDPQYYRRAGFKHPAELARAIRREYYFAKLRIAARYGNDCPSQRN